MKIKRYKNYITWEDKKGNLNTECNRASLLNDLCLTINTCCPVKVALARERERESKMSKDKIEVVGNYSPSSHSATKVMENHGERFAVENNDLSIRKITEKECMLLMGFDSEDYKAMKQAGLSTQAIAHIAGDSIVTTCIVSLLSPLIREEDDAHSKIIEQWVNHIVETRNN